MMFEPVKYLHGFFAVIYAFVQSYPKTPLLMPNDKNFAVFSGEPLFKPRKVWYNEEKYQEVCYESSYHRNRS